MDSRSDPCSINIERSDYVETVKSFRPCPLQKHLFSAVIMRESRSARGEVVTSGPRPLTWNLGQLNPEKGGVIGRFLKGGRVNHRK